jgi:ribonuclease Z
VPRQISAAGFSCARIDYLFITHFHSDHYSGLGGFVLTRWLMGATAPLQIYGPEPITAIVPKVIDSFQYDIDLRAAEGKPLAGSDVALHVVASGQTFDVEGMTVRAETAARHGNIDHLLSYRFEAEGRALVVIGDGAPTDRMVPLATGADVLLMHVGVAALIEEQLGQTPEQEAIIAKHHATPEQIGEVAAAAAVRVVVMSHIVPPMAPEAALVEGVSERFTGRMLVGEDLMRI